MAAISAAGHDYGDALRKSILFFEGQRSGKLPQEQRLRWRRDSALRDGADEGVRELTNCIVSFSSHSDFVISDFFVFCVYLSRESLNEENESFENFGFRCPKERIDVYNVGKPSKGPIGPIMHQKLLLLCYL